MTRLLNNHCVVALAALLVAVAAWTAFGSDPVPQIVIPCRVTRVYDGDTPTCEVTIRMRVRLQDCWAPEVTGREKKDGLKSRKRLEELALNKTGLLAIPLGDDVGDSLSLNRVVGRLFIDGRDINRQMVAEGFATKEKRK